MGRLTLPRVWDIILRYPATVQPASGVVSSMSSKASVERMSLHLKQVLHENRVQTGNDFLIPLFL